VNDLTPVGSSTYVSGFFHPRDLEGRFRLDGRVLCAGSNVGEIIYLMVPDAARAGSDPASPFHLATVLWRTPSTIGHELQHAINFGSRLARRIHMAEDIWLSEGLSQIAQELLFFASSNLQPGQGNHGRSVIGSDAYHRYQAGNIAHLQQYLGNPQAHTLMDTDAGLPTRGAAWAFLRWAADRDTISAEQDKMWRALVHSSTSGLDNLRLAFQRFPFPLTPYQAMLDWSGAVYADDTGFSYLNRYGTQYFTTSWNFRDLYRGEHGSYPLHAITLRDGVVETLNDLRGGSAAYLRFGVAANSVATVRATAIGQTKPPEALRLTIMRTK
jgi:hypothetical protein